MPVTGLSDDVSGRRATHADAPMSPIRPERVGQPRAEGTRLVTEGEKGRDGFEFPSRREARGMSD